MSNPPTVESVQYALKALQDVLTSIETRQRLCLQDVQVRVAAGDYASAAVSKAHETGLVMAETSVRIEIETLEHRLIAVQRYWASQP
jgi:hypothetical protein